MKHSEVATVKNSATELAGLTDNPPEIFVKLRSASGDIEKLDLWIQIEQLDDPFAALAVHLFTAIWARFNMAMAASEVATLTNVQLQSCDGAATRGRKTEPGEIVHKADAPTTLSSAMREAAADFSDNATAMAATTSTWQQDLPRLEA